MNREWKPGDVGITGNQYGGEDPVLFVVGDDGRFAYADGQVLNWPPRSDARPLVVIDPEDREQVERLAHLAFEGEGKSLERDTNLLWAALREFANPQRPKPEEPQGLGAVVEDEDGEQWVRHRGQIAPWHRADGQPTERPWRYYNDIAVVRVLSEGVGA